MGKIRLVCMFCDRDDYDFVETLPPDWFSVDEIEEYQVAMQAAELSPKDISQQDWFTHIGVCPTCYEVEIRPALVSCETRAS